MTAETPTRHLWEYDHPYYCAPHNYHVPLNENGGNHIEHDSWADFIKWWNGDAYPTNPEITLLFRWDWRSPSRDPHYPDESLPDELELFFMLQSKGDFWSHSVAVTDDDEPAIRAWLTERARNIAAVWEPILPGGDGTGASDGAV